MRILFNLFVLFALVYAGSAAYHIPHDRSEDDQESNDLTNSGSKFSSS